MEDGHFDALARAWGTPTGRRVVTKTLLGHALAGLGLALGLRAETQAKTKTKPKPKGCKRGTVKCGKTCVDTRTNARNCGRCGRRCSAGQSCAGGRCQGGGCPSGRTVCGTSCVDTQTDNANCGGCGNGCGSGKSCQGGQCVTPTCGKNELLCGGRCVPSVGAHPCGSQADCGGPTDSSNHIFCDTSQHQCRCVTQGYGICLRTADHRGICGECCAGGAGSLNCQGDLGCHGGNHCSCPAGESQCPGGGNQCYQDPPNADLTLNDPTVCLNAGGTSCVDCTDGGKKPYVCCWSRTCVDASGEKPNFGGTFGAFCGGCQKCSANKICCNDGQGGAPSCKDPANGGFCPLPGA
jgi:hypothetical protein